MDKRQIEEMIRSWLSAYFDINGQAGLYCSVMIYFMGTIWNDVEKNK